MSRVCTFSFTNKEIQQKIQNFKCKSGFFRDSFNMWVYKRRFCYNFFFIALYFLVNIKMSVHILHEKNVTLFWTVLWMEQYIVVNFMYRYSCNFIHFQRFSVALEYEKICNFGKFSFSNWEWDPQGLSKKYQFIFKIILFSIFRVLWYLHLHQFKLDSNEMILYTIVQ